MNALLRDILYSERNSTKSTRQWVITRKYVQVCTNSTSNQFAVYLEVLGHTWRFAVYNSTNRGINSTEFIIPAAVQYILPLIQTELTDAGYKFACWKYHTCNEQRSTTTMIQINLKPAKRFRFMNYCSCYSILHTTAINV